MKRSKILLGMLTLFTIAIYSSAAEAVAILSLQPSTTSPTVGSSFNVLVNVSAVTDLFAYQFDLQYNPSFLSANSVTEGPFLKIGGTTFFIPGTINNAAGLISFTSDSLIGAVAGVNGGGALAMLTFSAIGQGSSPLGLSNVELLDSNFNEIGFSSVGANIAPTQRTGIPEPGSAALMTLGLAGLGIFRRIGNFRR